MKFTEMGTPSNSAALKPIVEIGASKAEHSTTKPSYLAKNQPMSRAHRSNGLFMASAQRKSLSICSSRAEGRAASIWLYRLSVTTASAVTASPRTARWAKKNRGIVPQKHSAVDDVYADIDASVPVDMEPVTVSTQSTAEDSVLQTSIDLSTPKNTLEDVKKRIQLSIQRLEKKRISLGEEYNDKLETTLRGYYIELSRLTHTEVKMAEELKDSDKIDVATVTYVMNKLFQCVASAIVEVDNEKRALFFSVLNEKVKHTKNKILEETIKEL